MKEATLMNRYRVLGRSWGLAILALAITASLAAAKEKGTERPFKGVAHGVTTRSILGDPATGEVATFFVEYTGQATHLGKMTRYEVATLYVDGSIEGTMLFVAANGDEIFSTLWGQLDSFGPTANFYGCYEFQSGTGRFENVSGTTCFVGSTDFATVDVEFDGTFNY